MNTREEIILEILNKEKHIKVIEVAKLLKVTPETIRKDFDEMERKKLLKRVHGGAVVPHYFKATELDRDDRGKIQSEVKKRIANEVANNILSGESLIIDSGSTCYELAKILSQRSDLTIITPSIEIASVLNTGECRVYMLGGWLRKSEPSVLGDMAIELLTRFNVNKTILSVAGISEEWGLTEYMEEDANIKYQAIKCGEKTIIMADNAKFDIKALINVAPIEEIDEIYTDNLLPDEKVAAFEEKGVKVIRV